MTDSQLNTFGGPAYPSMQPVKAPLKDIAYAGMTMFDYFAAAALTGLLTRHTHDIDENNKTFLTPVYDDTNVNDPNLIAEQAFCIAKEMLAVRNLYMFGEEMIGGDA